MAEKKKMYKIGLELPICDNDDVLYQEFKTDDFGLIQEIINTVCKKLGVSVGWPKKGSG